jgi:tetratricopeptide (TPR) repeat protein
MRLRITRAKMISIFVLLPLAAVGAYGIGRYLWFRHHCRAAQQALEQRDFRRASDYLNHGLDVWPTDPSVRILAAQLARRQGDFGQARRHLKAHWQHNGSAEERDGEVQLLSIQEGDERQAAEAFARCTGASGGPESHLLLEAIIEADTARLFQAYHLGAATLDGEAGMWRTRAEKALDMWRQQRRGKADQVQAFFWEGKIQFVVDKQEATATFRKGLELDPGHTEMRLHLALTLTDYHAKEASRHLEILHRRDPKDTQAAVALASTLRGLGQLRDSQMILDQVLTANPDHVHALLERSKTALDAGRPDEAEPFLRRALTHSPRDSFVHLGLSRCLQLAGRGAEARYHEKLYSEIESERRQNQRVREEEARAAWRKRLEQERASGSENNP